MYIPNLEIIKKVVEAWTWAYKSQSVVGNNHGDRKTFYEVNKIYI